MSPRLQRLRGLVRKEVWQILRDPSALLIAFLLPFILLIINGFGLSLDAHRMKLAVVVEAGAAPTRSIEQALDASPYLAVEWAPSGQAARRALEQGEVRGILTLRQDFAAKLARPARWPAVAQLAVNATDPNTARLLQGYVTGAFSVWLQDVATERALTPGGGPVLETRYWYNPQLRSTDFIVPGVIALVMSMTGTLLTALIVAREWERGTMESMLASPAAMGELVGAKLGTYFVLGMGSMAMSVLITVFVFGVPLHGSLGALGLTAALFLVFTLAQGLFISTLARNQFVAAQLAFITTMLPAIMLSGMLFDIASMPRWLQWLTYVFPARYFVAAVQTLFLAGDVWSVLLPNLCGLAIAAALTVAATLAVTHRRLD
ncbi:ABC transporter permease [Acidocella sp. KAb 2-4]|uniref:ABC transporter permease n=1 Tax=Acidocella sp. KAb 2-4 TaxID=2885158 RepID=UPI001D070399|nr:ABC transporter permease [Acidocella sp. KAb 2-4]MCB5943866.1 ABC transporter permease [Acidocella sp. KAb 2-4]